MTDAVFAARAIFAQRVWVEIHMAKGSVVVAAGNAAGLNGSQVIKLQNFARARADVFVNDCVLAAPPGCQAVEWGVVTRCVGDGVASPSFEVFDFGCGDHVVRAPAVFPVDLPLTTVVGRF